MNKSNRIYRILIVEDQPNNMRLIEQLLDDLEEEIEVVKTFSGLEALLFLKDGNFDLILMDLALPDLDGIQVTKILRGLPQHKATPVIAVTAHAMTNDRAELTEFFNDYIPKPIEQDIFMEKIKKWIGRECYE